MKDFFRIDTETCNRDGICRAVCPVDAIDLSADGIPIPFSDGDAVCVRCGHCVAVCPTGSFRHREMDSDGCPPLDKALLPSPQQCKHLLKSRRSIRAYREKPVPRALLLELLEIAGYAPSAHNARRVEWRVFDSREEIRRLAGLTADWMRWVIETLPERAAELHLARRVARWERGVDGILRNAPVLVVAHGEREEPVLPPGVVPDPATPNTPLDYAIAVTYLELAATGLGLGACWAGYLYRAANAYAPLYSALALPEGHLCYGALMLGYPKFGFKRLPQRNPPPVTWG